MYFEWDEDEFTVHVPEMDSEHQVLIGKMNDLYAAYAVQAERKKMSGLLHDFASFAARHFRDEEAYMAKVAYSGLEAHKMIHDDLLKQVDGYVQEFDRTGHLPLEFFRFFTYWMSNHIQGIDRNYAPKT